MPTLTGSCDNSRYSLTCEYSFTQNVSANTSTITAKVYLNGNGYTTTSSHWSCVINGTTVTSNKSASIGGKTLLGSKTWTVNHASDGTCKTTISFSYKNGLSSAGTYTTKTGSGSASITLTTIPRGSTISLNRTSATIGSDAITVSLSRASSSYTHKVQLYFGSYSALLAEGIGTSYTFTPNISLCSQIPNATSGTATIKVQTMNGSTWIAETNKTITLNVPSSVVPTIGSVTATGNNLLSGIYVAGKSTVTAKINSAAGAYGSTIKSYSISGAGISSSSSSATSGVLGAGSYTITGKVTDSRGRTASKSISITVHSYYAPSLSIDLYRCNSDGTKNDSGTYARVYINQSTHNIGNANVNAKQYKIDWKKASSTSWTTLLDWTNISGYEDKWTHDLGSGWDNTVTYDVRVSIRDSYNTVSTSSSIGTISCVMNIEKAGIGIGKPHERGALDVKGAIYGTTFTGQGNGKNVVVGTGGTDVYLHNSSSGKYLQLKDDGSLRYSDNNILRDNYAYLAYGTALRGTVSDGSTSRRIAQVASHGGVDLGDTGCNTAICSGSQPTWWNGSVSRHLVYSENDSSGYPAILSNSGNSWIRTPSSGILPYQSANSSWDSANSSLGTKAWRFANGYMKELYCNGLKNDLGDLWLSSKLNDSNATIYIQTKWLCPSSSTYTYLGSSSYRWHSVWAANGAVQTSDERFKIKQGFTDIEECYEMIKDTNIYNYIMLSQNKEDLSKNRLGKLALSSSQEQVNVHMGIMAQDIQKYKCSKQILVEGSYERADGSTDTMLNVNPYGLTTAVMGALKVEIQKRELLEEKVAKLESLVEQLITQSVK